MKNAGIRLGLVAAGIAAVLWLAGRERGWPRNLRPSHGESSKNLAEASGPAMSHGTGTAPFVGSSDGDGGIPVLRSDPLLQEYEIAADGRSFELRRQERTAVSAPVHEVSVDFGLSFELEVVKFRGSELAFVLGHRGGESVLERWTFDFAEGSYKCQVHADGTRTTTLNGPTFIEPSQRAHRPMESRTEIYRGSVKGDLLDVEFTVPDLDVLLVLRQVGGSAATTVLSSLNCSTGAWFDVPEVTGMPQLVSLDSIGAYRLKSGAVFYVLNEQDRPEVIHDRIVLVDADLNNVFEQVLSFWDYDGWRQSPFYFGSGQVETSFMEFPNQAW
jgi:hypothetical protein